MDQDAHLVSKRLIPDSDGAMSPADVVARVPALIEAMLMAAHRSPRNGERAWQVISHRNGLQSEPYTLEEVGTGLDLTRERVRQIQKMETTSLAAAVAPDFQTPLFAIQPRVAESLAAVFDAGPTVDDPVVSENVLLSRLGLGPRVSATDLRRLQFLFGLRDLQRTAPDRFVGATWGLKTVDSQRLRRAMARVQELLSTRLITGATELEIAIAATGRNRKDPIDVRLVDRVLPLLPDIQRLSDGRVRARFESLVRPEDQAYRLLSDAPGPLELREIMRSINAKRRTEQRQIYRSSLSNVMSADRRFVAIATTGLWGLASRDAEMATAAWKHIVDALRTLGRPATPQEIADEIGSSALPRTLVITYLHQIRPKHVVQLNDRRWALSDWPEAQDRSSVRAPRRRKKVPTKDQVAVDTVLRRILGETPAGDISIGAAADGIVQELGRTRASAYYFIAHSAAVVNSGSGRTGRVRLADVGP